MKTHCSDQKTKTLVCTLCKVSLKCHCSTSAIQEHVKKCTILDDPKKKINLYWSILSNQKPVIMSRYLIEEEEDEEVIVEERDVEALAKKTRKSNQMQSKP